MRIVIAEQDAALGVFLRKGLAGETHQVSWTSSYDDAFQLAETDAPDLMVIDVSSETGVELLKSVHRDHRRVAVLTLLHSGAVEDRVRCLDLGADDCLAKPFSFSELTARCRALLRRQERSEEILLSHGSLTLNRVERSANLCGEPVSLTSREFGLLEHLLQNAGRCCSRGELLTEVFQLAPTNQTNVVDVYVNYLRKKLANAPECPQIVTVRGAGYRLARVERMAPGMSESKHLGADLHANA